MKYFFELKQTRSEHKRALFSLLNKHSEWSVMESCITDSIIAPVLLNCLFDKTEFTQGEQS
jgi:hypothetical protein